MEHEWTQKDFEPRVCVRCKMIESEQMRHDVSCPAYTASEVLKELFENEEDLKHIFI